MAKIINSTEGKRLFELDQFHSMLSDDYLTDKKNLQTKFIYEQFFMKNSKLPDERLALLNISYSLPSLITEKFADYVGQPITALDFDLDDFVSSFIWGGMAIFRPKLVDGEFIVDYATPAGYILEDDGSERLLTYYNVYDAMDRLTQYILDEKYFNGTVTRTLYKVTKQPYQNEYSVNGEPVPLTTIQATALLPESETFPQINGSPLVKIHNRKITGIKYGTSEIRKVRSLISSIEIEAVNIQDQFLKHLQAKLALPQSAGKVDPETGLLNIRDIEAFTINAGDPVPQFVLNTNPLIEKSFQQIEDFTRQICAILTIPTEFVGLKDVGGAESADAKKIKLTSFIKKIEKIRSKFEDGLYKLNDVKMAWTGKKEDFSVVWPEIFPEDLKEIANELTIAQDSKLISNVKAIMRYQGLTEEEALLEQETINKENATISAAEIGV